MTSGYIRQLALSAAAMAALAVPAGAHAGQFVILPPIDLHAQIFLENLQTGLVIDDHEGSGAQTNSTSLGGIQYDASAGAGGSLMTVSGTGSSPPNLSTTFASGAASIAIIDAEVVAPTGDPITSVPILVAADLSSTGSTTTIAGFHSFATLSVAGAQWNSQSCGLGCTSSPDQHVNAMVPVLSQTVFQIIEEASISLGDGIDSGSATVDPFLQIDPTFLAQHPGYQLEFSPGFDNSQGVPEPAAWTLMVLGFGGLGAALRRAPAQWITSDANRSISSY